MTTTKDTTTVEITGQRNLRVERVGGAVDWQVTQFDGGRAYMLVVRVAGMQFSVHFDPEQWAGFRGLVEGGPIDAWVES